MVWWAGSSGDFGTLSAPKTGGGGGGRLRGDDGLIADSSDEGAARQEADNHFLTGRVFLAIVGILGCALYLARR